MYSVFIKRDDYSYENLLASSLKEYPNDYNEYSARGVGNNNVFFDNYNKTLYTNWSTLFSSGVMDINLSSIVSSNVREGTAFYDGLGLFINKLSSKETLSLYAPYSISYPTVQTLYNLYTNKTFEGFIGAYNSVYNRIPINLKDKVLRYYDCPKYYLKPYFCLAEATYKRQYHKFKSSLNREPIYVYDIPWVSVWRHMPMWYNSPDLELRNYLRIVTLKLAADRVQFKRDLFIGICHKKELKKKRILLFSYLGSRLAPMKVDQSYTQLIKNILSHYEGYTSNAYFSWFYFPVIEPIEYQKIFQRANKLYNTLPGNLLDKVFL